MPADARKVAYAAVAANCLIALTKFGAAWYTGSSAMWSEGIHSLVDTANEWLLLYGIYRASRPADEDHPFGHGRELYFWSFIVAVFIFSLGAGLSLYEGVVHLSRPAAIKSPLISLGVLALSAVFDGWSWSVAYREFNKVRGPYSFFEAIRRSKDPAPFVVLLEDSADLVGIAIAFTGILASVVFEMPVFDAMASVGIAILLASTAIFLAREVKGLLIGEPARPSVRRAILALAEQAPEISQVCTLSTVQLGPEQVLALLTVRFAPELDTSQIEHAVSALQQTSIAQHPEIVAVFVSPASKTEA